VLFARCEPPRPCLRHGVASSLIVGSRWEGRAVRAADPVAGCLGFSPRQLWLRSPEGACSPTSFGSPMHARVIPRPRTETPDPLRFWAGGAESDVATADVRCRLVGAIARAPTLAFAGNALDLRRAIAHPTLPEPRHTSPGWGDLRLDPERLLSARASASRPSEALRVRCYVRAERLAPFRPTR